MTILCDMNMPLARTLFSTLGKVTLVDGNRLSAAGVKDADMLILREPIPLDANLLEGSAVKFLGVAMTGTEQLDRRWLATAGITWASAPRANGESVADYCMAALLEHGHMRQKTLAGKTVAVIGCGWIGGMIVKRCRALGMNVVCCDPPRQANRRDQEAQSFVSLEEALAQADYILPFVPLTREGAYATYHMLDEVALAKVKYGAVLINMARGAVADTAAVCAALKSGALSDGIFDVWESESNYSVALATLAFLATPHLAGSSYEGKVNGTWMVYRSACEFLGREPALLPTLPPPIIPRIEMNVGGMKEEEVLWYLTQQVSMIVADHLRFQDTFAQNELQRKRAFLALRKTYAYRRQYSATTVVLQHATLSLRAKVEALGFKLA